MIKMIRIPDGSLVFVDKLIKIMTWFGDTYYDRKVDELKEDGLIVAYDINGKEIILGEFEDYGKAKGIEEDIVEWIKNDCDLNPYEVVPDDDFDEYDNLVECQREYIEQFSSVTYDKFYTEFMQRKRKKSDETEEKS